MTSEGVRILKQCDESFLTKSEIVKQSGLGWSAVDQAMRRLGVRPVGVASRRVRYRPVNRRRPVVRDQWCLAYDPSVVERIRKSCSNHNGL